MLAGLELERSLAAEAVAMDVAYFRTLFAYNVWARDKLFAAIDQLTAAEYLAPRPLDYGSLHGTLVHTYAAELLWLSRWRGVSPERMLDSHDVAGLAELKRRWIELEQQLAAFLAATADAQLETSVDYRSTEGEQWRRPLWETLAHLINHGTHHRSEVATVVTQLGHSPGDLDLIAFFNQRAA